MTNILAIETSGSACSVALNRDGEVSQILEVVPREHARKVLPMVDDLLCETGMSLVDIDAIAFARGPGSFTGLRIGFGIVQGLALGCDIPVIGISTLQALAYKAAIEFQLGDGIAAVALDARMNELYWGIYTVGGEGLPVAVLPDCAITAENALLSVQWPVSVALGDGWNLMQSQGLAVGRVHPEYFLDAATLAVMGRMLFDEGQFQDILSAELAYVRNEISWKKRVKLRT
jgi:tRNA threonylcarbamoyladenosine biosynthesis protein TsaB